MGFFRNLFKSKEEILSEKLKALSSQELSLSTMNYIKLAGKKNETPLIKARNKLVSTLTVFEKKRNELDEQWDAAYKSFSWWNKLKHDETLDLRDLDSQIRHLKQAVKDFDERYQSDLIEMKKHFDALHLCSEKRIRQAHDKLVQAVEKGLVRDVKDTSLSAAWLAMLSVPVSIADDLISANQVYDSLRAVNSNFEGMSNDEIWWETLWMSPESHAGLVSLTKGAYFQYCGQFFEY